MDDSGEVYTSMDFLAAVGAVALNWAVIEGALDFAIATIFHELRNDKMEPEIPRGLEKKIAFLRQSLRHPKLAPIRAQSRALLTALKNTKDERHSLVHGPVMAVADHGDTVLTLQIRYTKTRHRLSSVEVTTEQVEARAHTAHALSDRATRFSVAVFNIAHPEKPIDYPLGEFAG